MLAIQSIWSEFYTQRAWDYDRLVQVEDYQGNLFKTISVIYPLTGARVVEFGAGTGRITSLLSRQVEYVAAFDQAPLMLALAKSKLEASGQSNWHLALGENRHMPVSSGWADLAVEGWSFLHLKTWYPDTWVEQVSRAMDEMKRVLRPEGLMLVIETLGTGHRTPYLDPQFQPFYDLLEGPLGFQRTWTRTDYQFTAGSGLLGLFREAFGENVTASMVETEAGVILPECTGLWWRRNRANA